MASFARTFWKYRSVKFVIALCGIWLLLAFICAAILPAYIKDIAETQITEQTGRKVSIDKVNVNLLTLSVYVHDVTFYEPDGSTPALSAKELVASASVLSLFKLAPIIDRITLTEPNLHIVRLNDQGSGTYNFTDIIQKFSPEKDEDTQKETDATPMHFSLADVSVINGKILLEDQVTGKNIDIQHLNIQLPYFSNFPNQKNLTVAPGLQAQINGTPIDLLAKQTNNEDAQISEIHLQLDHLHLTEYLPFVPVSLPVHIQSSELSTNLTLHIQTKEASTAMTLDGLAQLDNVHIQDKAGHPLLKTEQAAVNLRDFDVLQLTGHIDQVTIKNPEVWTALDTQGTLNWLKVFSTDKKEDDSAPRMTDIVLHQLQVDNGKVYFTDAAYAKPAANITLDQISIQAKDIATKADAPAGTLIVSALENQQGSLFFKSQIQPTTGDIDGQLQLRSIALNRYSAYIKPHLNSQINGILSANAALTMHNGQLTVNNIDTTIGQFALKPAQGGSVTATTLSMVNGKLDIAKQTLDIDGIYFSDVDTRVSRNKEGKFNFVSETSTTSKQTAHNKKESKPWVVTLNQFVLQNGQVHYTDQFVQPQQTIALTKLNVQANHLSSALNSNMQLQVTGNINQNGSLAVKASATPQLAKTLVDIDINKFPILPLQSFIPQNINITLRSGDISTKGTLTLAHVQDERKRTINYTGGAQFQRFNVIDDTTRAPFLRFAQLDINQIDTRLSQAAPFVSVGSIHLSDFFARAVLTEDAKLNLQQIVVFDANKDSNDNASSEAATASTTTTVKTAASTASAESSKPVIHIGQVNLNKGNVNFTDNFVKPNYRVNLTGLHGTIGAIHSDQTAPAPIDIKGKIDNDATVVISGAFNPLFSPIFLDIKANANGVELPRLTPYSTKYAGYPIEKGKLSVEVNYKIQNDQLTANNNLKIDQLTFGDHIDSPTATKLPVMLAVSLLKDRNGQINLDLPISGSLSDPQFSVGGIILRAFVNLILKAVTSPFALIGSMFGGGEELSHLEFASGSAVIPPGSIKKLDTVNYAMMERPALTLDIIGRADPKEDKAGLITASLYRQMQALKWQSTGKTGSPLNVKLTPDEEQKYLTQLYKKADFKKPTNMIGLDKTVSVDEMKQLLIDNTPVSDQDLQNLAMKRADVIRAYMQDEAIIPAERLFIVAPKITTQGLKANETGNRVDFVLK